MLATLESVDAWIAVISGVVGLILGTVLSAVLDLTRWFEGRRTRRGDLAAVALAQEHWHIGHMSIPMTQLSGGSWIDSQRAAGFPITVKNASGDKITNIEFGLRWRHDSSELNAGYANVLVPDDETAGIAWAPVDEEWDPWDFDQDWLARLDYFVRFDDQHGKRHENVLSLEPRRNWTSKTLS